MSLIEEIKKSLEHNRKQQAELKSDDVVSISLFKSQENMLLEKYEQVCKNQPPLMPGDIMVLSDMMKIYEDRVQRATEKLENMINLLDTKKVLHVQISWKNIGWFQKVVFTTTFVVSILNTILVCFLMWKLMMM